MSWIPVEKDLSQGRLHKIFFRKVRAHTHTGKKKLKTYKLTTLITPWQLFQINQAQVAKTNFLGTIPNYQNTSLLLETS